MIKKIKASIPNTITLLNLLSGCIAVVAALRGDLNLAFWMVIVAAVFDFFDGFAARLLGVSSPMGKELDSLADVVSFGVAPSAVLYTLMVQSGAGVFAFSAFVIAAFSALRLAKFNLDTRQGDEFRGVPTPASALFFISLPEWIGVAPEWIFGTASLSVMIVIFAALMVCDIPMLALKFKSYAIKKNVVRYVFILLSVILIIAMGQAAPAAVIVCYIIISVATPLICKHNRQQSNK